MPVLTRSGRTLAEYIAKLAAAAIITEGDIVRALGNQGRRIEDRTCSGLDYQDQAFAPYSTRGPYYYSPGGRGHKQKMASALHHARYYGGQRSRGATSVKYGSYSDYKSSTGSGVVDLGGMEGRVLSNLEVSVGGSHFTIPSAMTLNTSYPTPAQSGAIGVYEEPAATIAGAHNQGNSSRHLPQREFLGISASDYELILIDIANSVLERMNDSSVSE